MKHRTGHLLRRGDAATYYLRYTLNGKIVQQALRDNDGQPITDRRAAEKKRAEIMAPFAIADEATVLETIAVRLNRRKSALAAIDDQQTPALTVDAAWAAFIAAPNRPDTGPSTLGQYAIQFDRFRRWLAEEHPDVHALRGVSKAIAGKYAAHLTAAGLSGNTFNKYMNLLNLVFRVLKETARMADNPWETIQRKRLNGGYGRRELTIEELRKVCTTADGELRTLLAIGVYSGLRLGDCATLRWGEVDLARNIIRRIPNKTARRNPRPVLIPVHPILRAILDDIPSATRRDYVLPDTAATYQGRADTVTDRIQTHFAKCGIRTSKPGTGKGTKKRSVVEVGFHSLRHTFVSLCRGANAPLAVVEAIVGHSSPAMTRHYTHVGELAAGAAVAALPDITGTAKAALPAPPAGDSVAVLKARIRELADRLTPENATVTKADLLSLLAKA